jgi:hypothetical protein
MTTYPDIEHYINEKSVVVLKKDLTIPSNTVYWDTVNVCKIWKIHSEFNPDSRFVFSVRYNLTEAMVLSSESPIKSSFKTIFNSYICDPKGVTSLRKVPSPTSQIPEWATYNPEHNCFVFSADLILNFTVDTSRVAECSYRTSPSSSIQPSDAYQYANLSRTCVCSHPSLQNGTSVQQCYYNSSYDRLVQRCQFYTPDENNIALINLKNKNNSNSFQISATIFRKIDAGYRVEIQNASTNSIISNLDYSSIVFSSDKSSLYKEVLEHLNEIISPYLENYDVSFEYDITKVDTQSVSVNIKTKSSYISSLLSKDSYDQLPNQIDQLLETV